MCVELVCDLSVELYYWFLTDRTGSKEENAISADSTVGTGIAMAIFTTLNIVYLVLAFVGVKHPGHAVLLPDRIGKIGWYFPPLTHHRTGSERLRNFE
jgi:hypothetical protein